MPPATINFWFEFGSPYSMISALRLLRALTGQTNPNSEQLQALSSCQLPNIDGVRIVYQPIFLGAVFKASGQQMLPKFQVPAKTKHLLHDVQRTLNLLGCPGFPSAQPSNWPPNTALAGRMAWMLAQGPAYVCALDKDTNISAKFEEDERPVKVLAEFVWRIFESEFITHEDIGDSKVLSRLWDVYVARSAMGSFEIPSGKRAVELASTNAVKSGFKDCTQAAIDCKLFGSPSFTTDDGDMYWGNDRLGEAVAHHRVRHLINQPHGYCTGSSNSANI
ncbi:hypothetical protein IWW36_005047 [Coemansia brasiliensis]|uniref:DSBA-like thioredoxin domain-containing protein n=1 Tax=Coemansia brasiliensis TaxID=2650707 RepID=A0A9W8I269_9FUNG|nr:hypothetical protein IWW36_005047 [Coemansia brasiliensis]